jgi:hypothetical protein
MEDYSSFAPLPTQRTQTRVVQMKRLYHYFTYKSLMMQHLGFAAENVSMQDSLYHLICYHFYKDKAQHYYFAMTHNERETLHKLMIL